jgi:DNA polymerase-1
MPVDVCLPGIGRRDGIMAVSRLPLSKRRREELDDYFAEAGMPGGVFHTAANRCRVWEDSPSRADVKACRPYLEQEIEDLKPRVVVALGNEALLSLTGHSGIMKWRGRELAGPGASRVLATVSPAMVARNPGQREGLLADLRAARRLADGSSAPTAPPGRLLSVTTRQGLERLREALRAAEGVYLDIETNGFNEYNADSLIVCICLTVWGPGATEPEAVWAVPLAHPDSPWAGNWQRVVRWLFQPLRRVKKVVAHNGKFDLRWLHQFGCPVDLTFDTMLAAHMLNENRPKGLGPLAQSVLGVANWKIDTKNLMEEPLPRVLKYCALDTWYGAHLYFPLRAQLLEQPRLARLMSKMLVPASNVFVDVERRGIWTDRELLATNGAIARRTLADIDAELVSLVPPREKWPDGIKEMNFNASNFARWLLFDHFGYPVLGRGKDKDDGGEGMPSMAESIMLKLQADHPSDRLLQLMIERTKWQKYSTAFFAAYEEQIDENDRIHTTFKITGTVTGRLSSGKADADKVSGRVQNRGVNLQQVPRDNFVRGIFGAPPGALFVECDYSQIELRVAAFLARERHLLHLYATGQDVHMTMAMRMTNKPESAVTKEERKKAKAVNFGFLFGMGANKFIETAWNNYGVVVSEPATSA